MLLKNFPKRIAVLFVVLIMITTVFTSCKPATVAQSKSSSSTYLSDATSIDEQTSSNSSSSITSSFKSQLSTSKRPVVSGAPSAPPKKDTISIPPEIVIDIKPVADSNLKETIKDMNGKTFTYATFWPHYYTSGSSYPRSTANANAIKSIEKDYNCKIKMVTMTYATYLKDINTAKAAGKIYANIFDSELEMGDLYKTGILADLRTVKSVNLSGNDWNKAFMLASSYKGGIYGVGVDQDKILRSCVFFNKTIAAKYGLGNLYDLVKRKKWTFDKFLELSQNVYNKSNKTVYGSIFHVYQYGTRFIYADGASPVKLVNNKVLFNGNDDKVLKCLNFLQDYVKQGLIDKKLLDLNGPNNKATGDQTSAFIKGKGLFFITEAYMRSALCTLMKDDYGLLPYPIGPDTKDYISLISNTEYFSLFNQDPDIENSGVILTALANRMNIKIADWDKSAASTFRDHDSIDMMHLLMNSDPVYPATGNDDFDLVATPAIMNQTQTPKQAMDAIAKSEQIQLDKVYN